MCGWHRWISSANASFSFRLMARTLRIAVLTLSMVIRLMCSRLGSFLDDWEAQHGALTQEELARARDEMRPLPLDAGSLRQGVGDEASPLKP
jgi:hypothetical protein